MIRRATKKLIGQVFDETKRKLAMITFDKDGNRMSSYSNITILHFLEQSSWLNREGQEPRIVILVEYPCPPDEKTSDRIEDYQPYVVDFGKIIKKF